MSVARLLLGDVRETLASLPESSVDLVLTSPPFLALRSYLPADHPAKAMEIGAESTPEAFIDTLLDVTEACERVLAPHGTLAFELGDTYAGGGQGPDARYAAKVDGTIGRWTGERCGWPLDKSLCLIPESFRWALVYGHNPFNGRETPRWRARNVVRWVRPNPPVGFLGDKFRPATSDLVVACKAKDRWFDLDAVRTEALDQRVRTTNGVKMAKGDPAEVQTANYSARVPSNPAGAPPLDWWSIPPEGYDGSHYATWPTELLVRPVEAMCPRRVCRSCGQPSRRIVESERVGGRAVNANGGTREQRAGRVTTQQANGMHYDGTATTTTGWTSCGCAGTDGLRLDGFHSGTGWRPGLVLDPFGGSGTTAVVATGHGRDCLLIDLDERNEHLARERLGMFLEVGVP